MTSPPNELEPIDGVTGLLRAFDRYPLVAVGEMHGIEQGAWFVEQVVRHPAFAERVQIVVVEFGNALHQHLADAYVAGADVASSELRRIWYDFIGAGPWGFRQPIYPAFFATIRAVNESLPPSRRIRVLLGDPPADWQGIHAAEEIDALLGERDDHFARVVSEDVLRVGRHALLLSGAFHLMKRHPSSLPSSPFAVQLLERDHPGSTYVVLPHDPGVDAPAELEARLAGWPVPGLAPLAGTWLGRRPARTMFGGGAKRELPDGTLEAAFAGSETALEQVVDAYLYLGPVASFTRSPFDDRPVDEADRVELSRRLALRPDPVSRGGRAAR